MDKLKELLGQPKKLTKKRYFAVYPSEDSLGSFHGDGRPDTNKEHLLAIIVDTDQQRALDYAWEKFGGEKQETMEISKQQMTELKKKSTQTLKALTKAITVPANFKVKDPEASEEPYTGGSYLPGDRTKNKRKDSESW